MSSLTKTENIRATKVWFTQNMLYLRLEDGREIGAPLDWFPKLINASDDERNGWRLIGNGIGIHWEALDEDVSVKALLE